MPLSFDEISNELHKQVIHNFPRRQVVALYTDQIYATDLMDFIEYEKDNKGYKYLLCIVDVFSKYAWLVPLKDKQGKTIVNAFRNVINDSGRKPALVWSDKGKEYYNKDFEKFLKQNKIKQYSTYGDSKCVIAERFNRTIKNWIWKYFTAKHTRDWISIIDELCEMYNERKHRSIGMKPSEAIKKENHEKVFKKLYNKRLNEMANTDTPPAKFKVGDIVRVVRIKDTFEHGFHDNWSKATYTITEVKPTIPITYLLKEYDGEPIQGSFYEQELQKTKEPDFYEVEELLKERKYKGKKQYFVKFMGWDNKFNQWIDADQIEDIKKK